MVYLLIMERWSVSYQELMDTPHDIVQDMLLVMEAEAKVEDERPKPKK